MYFVGFVDLNNDLVFPILTENTSRVPTNADAAPSYDVYNADMSAKLITGGTSSALSGVTGAYVVSETLTSGLGFAAGNNYVLLATWAISTSARRAAYRFTVT